MLWKRQMKDNSDTSDSLPQIVWRENIEEFGHSITNIVFQLDAIYHGNIHSLQGRKASCKQIYTDISWTRC